MMYVASLCWGKVQVKGALAIPYSQVLEDKNYNITAVCTSDSTPVYIYIYSSLQYCCCTAVSRGKDDGSSGTFYFSRVEFEVQTALDEMQASSESQASAANVPSIGRDKRSKEHNVQHGRRRSPCVHGRPAVPSILHQYFQTVVPPHIYLWISTNHMPDIHARPHFAILCFFYTKCTTASSSMCIVGVGIWRTRSNFPSHENLQQRQRVCMW